jgi:hypothetical protein
MPSLKDVINKDTYVELARKGGGTVVEFESGQRVSPPRGSPAVTGPQDQSIWFWELPTTGPNLDRVLNVECWSRGMAEAHPGNPDVAWFTVCLGIAFGKEANSGNERGVFVIRPNDRVFLPLTAKYLWKGFMVTGGKNAGAAGDPDTWWPLAADIDSGFSLVFVYELKPAMAAVPDPLPSDDPDFADNPTVFPDPGATTAVTTNAVPVNKTGTGVIGGKDYSQRHFVVVVMSLICNKERADFEPGALVGMGRMIPHLQFLSSKELDRAEAVIELQRPGQSGYFGSFANPGGVRVMNHPDMDVNVGALLVTDTNVFRAADGFNLVNVPYWDLIFDYVLADPGTAQPDWTPGDTAKVVDRLRRGKRTVKGAIKVLDYTHVGTFVRALLASGFATGPLAILGPLINAAALVNMTNMLDAILSRPALRVVRGTGIGMVLLRRALGASLDKAAFLPRKPVDFEKLDRQGDFDSVHLAPRMKAHKLIAPTGSDEKLDDAVYELSSIAMAPFCEHDCLHTHWRWGKNWDDLRIRPLRKNEQPLRGFGSAGAARFTKVGRPYAPSSIGLSMVPLNQSVSITLPSVNRLRYEVSINTDGETDHVAIAPGVWQIVFHHGSAYALTIADKVAVGAAQLLIAFSLEFSELYWNMRFQAATDGKEERIQIVSLASCMNT